MGFQLVTNKKLVKATTAADAITSTQGWKTEVFWEKFFGFLGFAVQRDWIQNYNPRRTSYAPITPLSLSDHFLQIIISKLTNRDQDMNLNMICVKLHQT